MDLKREMENYCLLCYKSLTENSSSEGILVDDGVLELLTYLITKLNVLTLKGSFICTTCLSKVHEVYNFKSFHLKSKSSVTSEVADIKEDYLKCHICRNSAEENKYSAVSELELNNTKEILEYVIPGYDLQNIDNSLVCEICKNSIKDFTEILTLISLHKQHERTCDDDCDDTFVKVPMKQETVNSKCVPSVLNNTVVLIKNENITVNPNSESKLPILNINIKEELKDEPTVGCGNEIFESSFEDEELPQFETKNEEIDIKIEEHDQIERSEEHNKQEKSFKESSLKNSQRSKQNCRKNKLINGKASTIIRKTPLHICEICKYQTRYITTLKNHMLTHKSSEELKLYKCQFCDFRTKYKNMKRHMLIHKNPDEIEMFKCYHCAFQTKYKKNLRIHMLVHKHPKELEMSKCQICEFQSKYKSDVKKHMVVHKNPAEIEMYKCEICEFQTRYKNSLKSHELTHKCDWEIEMYKCHICTYQTKYKRHFKWHMLIHKQPI